MNLQASKQVKAFTIVELLIVIVVIAILAAISVVAYNGIQDRARKSAQLSQLSQTEKEITVWALQKNGESIALSGDLIGYQIGAGQSDLSKAIVGTTDITMYVAYVFIDQSAHYGLMASLAPGSATQRMALDTNPSGDSVLRYRIDTSMQTNVVAAQGNTRLPNSRVVGWLQTSNNAQTRSFAYNQAASANVGTLTAHAGWNFTSLIVGTMPGGTPLASLVFAEAHDQTTRSQVLGWLAEKYNVPGSF